MFSVALAPPWARELLDLYVAVGDLLEQQGVAQARYRVKPAEGGVGLAVMTGMAAGIAANGSTEMQGLCPSVPLPTMAAPVPEWEDDFSDAEAIRRRRAPMPKRLTDVGAGIEPYDAPLPPDYYAAIRQQLARLDSADQTATASHQTRERTALEIKARAISVSQARGIEAMRRLVAHLADDVRILAPLRQAIVALEPALLRLTLAEPRFFSDEGHPARRFIEALAGRGWQFTDEYAADFDGFIAPVRVAIRALIALAEPTGPDFDLHLQTLQALWQPEDQAAHQAAERGQRILTFAQARQRLADHVARDFSQRSDLTGVPAVVAGFLFRDWSLVIAHAQLADAGDQLDPGGYLSIVTNLLWSVKHDEILNDSARLFEVVPRVLVTLRRGLEMLGKDPRESQALLDMLLGFHEPVLKLRRARIALDQGATPEELAEALDLPDVGPMETGEPSQPQPAEHPWIGRHERQVIGFIDNAVIDPLSAESAKTAACAHGPDRSGHMSGPETADEPEAEARVKIALSQLRRGDWVDLCWRQTRRRAELTWISEDGALYLLVSRGGKAHGMTRPTLEALLRTSRLRPVATGAVVARALEADARD